MFRSWSRWNTKIFSWALLLPIPASSLFYGLYFFRRLIALTYAGNTCLMKVSVCTCIGFSEFDKPAMCKISHSHFYSIMLFVLPFRIEYSTYFILGKVCHFVGRLKHKDNLWKVAGKRKGPFIYCVYFIYTRKNYAILTDIGKPKELGLREGHVEDFAGNLVHSFFTVWKGRTVYNQLLLFLHYYILGLDCAFYSKTLSNQ